MNAAQLVPILASQEDAFGQVLPFLWGVAIATSVGGDVLVQGLQVPGRQFGPVTAARLGGLLEGE